MRPMLATPTTSVPTGDAWLHEVKWDGMRILADVHDGELTLTSRNGNDVTASYPELAGLADTYEDLLLDGEVVALDAGRPSFAALAERMHVQDRHRAERLAATRPVTYMVFDLLRLFGQDLTAQPLSARRELLERLDLDGRHWQVPPVYADGQELFRATQEQGLEGVVSKRLSSPYQQGRRSTEWLKSPHRTTVSAVVGGWRPEKTNDAGRSAQSSSVCPRRRDGAMPAGWAAGSPAPPSAGWPSSSSRCASSGPPSATRCPRSTRGGRCGCAPRWSSRPGCSG